MRKINAKGITLVSLVITIIILIILAGIAIHMALGNNGILTKTQEAKEEYKISNYHDLIEMDKGTAVMDKLGKVTIYDVVDEISNDEKIPIADIEVKDEETAIVITEEGYKYEVKLEHTKYIEKIDTKQLTKEVYAVLSGNTLKFFSNKENAQAEGGKLYDENIGEKVFTRTGTWPNKYPDTPWYNDRESIEVISFENIVSPTNMDCYFEGLSKLTTINNPENLKTYNVTSMNFMLASCTSLTNIDNFLTKINTRNVTSMNSMFYNCTSLTSVNLSKFNTSKVTNMNSMFNTCKALTSLDLSNFDTSNVTSMGYMFQSCEKITTIDVSKFNTSKVKEMNDMFALCYALEKIDVSKFNTSNVTNMSGMFLGCFELTQIDVSSFDTRNVTKMDSMFGGIDGNDSKKMKLTEIKGLEKFNTSMVTDIREMFYNCASLTQLDLRSFNIEKATNLWGMFYGCGNLNEIKVLKGAWNTAGKEVGNMFKGCKVSKVTEMDA